MEFYCSRNRAKKKIRLFIVIILIDGCFVSCRSQSIDPNQNVNLIFTLHSVWSDSAKKNGEKEPNLHEIYSDLIGTTSQFAHSFQHFSFELRITFVVNSFLLFCVAGALDLLLLVSMFFISLKNSEKFWFSIWWNKHQDEGERERKKSQPFEVSGWKEIGGESKREKREAISSRRHFWHLFVYLCTYVQFSFCFALFTLCLPFFRVSLHLRCHEYGWSWSVLFLFFSVCVCLSLFHRSAILRLLLLLCFTLTGFLLKCTAQWSRMISVFLQFVFFVVVFVFVYKMLCFLSSFCSVVTYYLFYVSHKKPHTFRPSSIANCCC